MLALVAVLPIFLISGFLLIRLILVMIGMHKAPLLALFEKYGDDENHFYPLPRMMLWLGIFLISTQLAFSEIFNLPSFIMAVGVFLVIIVYMVSNFIPDSVREYLQEFPPFPPWYHDLRARTERDERRRIAYMWLRLPLRTRLLFNSNNRAFFQWADLIIMATVTKDEIVF
ncbi:MAG: hypothetical protein RLP44_10785 [Aggregatilineales bacterium]